MLDLEQLFKIHPFVFCIKDVYYAFGSGVCEMCDNEERRYIALPSAYQRYLNALNMSDISNKDAWDVYRRVNNIAEHVRIDSEHVGLKERFNELAFSDNEKDELQNQLEKLTSFFSDNRLSEYCTQI